MSSPSLCLSPRLQPYQPQPQLSVSKEDKRVGSKVALNRAAAASDWGFRRIRQLERSASESRLRRWGSLPDFSLVGPSRSYRTLDWLDYRYRPSYKWTLDEIQFDRYLYRRPLYTYPYDSDVYYPYSRYYSYRTYRPLTSWDLYPPYWRRYHDPYYYRPLYSGYRPYAWETYDANRAISLYRSGLISYDALDKYWISPYTSYRRADDWRTYGSLGTYPYSSLYYPYSYYYRPSYWWNY